MRKTSQEFMPRKPNPTPPGDYDLYPGFPVGSGQILNGFDQLAQYLSGYQHIILDGYGGVFWQVAQPIQQSQAGEGQCALLVAQRRADLGRLAGLAETVAQAGTRLR